MTRLLPRFVVALLVVATCLLGTELVAPVAASATPCTNDNNWANASGDEAGRCINGVNYVTRRKLSAVPGCLGGPLVQGQVYLTRKACYRGGAVEAIARPARSSSSATGWRHRARA